MSRRRLVLFSGGQQEESSELIGDLFFTDFPSGLIPGDFIDETPGVTFSPAVGGGVTTIGGGVNFSNRLTLNQELGFRRWEQTLKFVVDEITGDSYGIGLSIIPTNGTTGNASMFIAQLLLASGLNGQVWFYISEAISNVAPGHSMSALSATDIVEFKLGLLDSTIYVKGSKNGGAFEDIYDFTYDTTNHSFPAPNIGRPRIYFFGGQKTFISYKLATSYWTRLLLAGGNSITCYHNQGEINNYLMTMFGGDSSRFVRVAGSGDTTVELLKTMDSNIIKAKPKFFLLETGINDSTALTTTEFEDNLNLLIDDAEANNMTVIMMTVLPAANTELYNDKVINVATARNKKLVDIRTAIGEAPDFNTYAAAYTNDGGTHLNSAGGIVVGNTIVAAAPEILL